MDVHLYIQNGQTVYEPVALDSVVWETKRKGEPGKCSFTLFPDSVLRVEEGNAVRVDVDGRPVFLGFIFERSWSGDGQVKVTAYDQLRYLKNTESYNYENKTAGEVIRMIAADFHLNVGELEDTGFVIPSRNMKDKTLFDIVLDALDLTMIYAGTLFVFYDDAGKLTLKNVENMKLGVTIDSGTAQDYDYKVSIDRDTYNQIKLYRDNEETRKREVFMVKHTENINKWGILQYHESIEKGVSGQEAAERYLALYNRPARSLAVKGAFGDIRVRAGCLLPVFLDLKDMRLRNYLLIEAVTHRLERGVHTMDLTLKGAGISG